MDIKVAKRSMDRFKRIARRRYPLEYLEILIGRISPEAIEIVKSVPILHTATLDSANRNAGCEWEDSALEILKLKAGREGLVFLGTIHSHPDYSTNTVSEGDNASALTNQEQVFGIYSFKKNGKTGHGADSKLCFYLPQKAVSIQTP